MIIGGVNGTTQYCYDVVGLSGHKHENDTENGGTYDVLEYSVSEDISSTTLEVVIPLNTGDSLDPVLELGKEADFFFAYSQNNDSMIIQDHVLAPRSEIISAMIEDEQLDIDDFVNV